MNDNAPIIQNSDATFTAPCDIPNAFVGTLYATDADVGRNGQINYSFKDIRQTLG